MNALDNPPFYITENKDFYHFKYLKPEVRIIGNLPHPNNEDMICLIYFRMDNVDLSAILRPDDIALLKIKGVDFLLHKFFVSEPHKEMKLTLSEFSYRFKNSDIEHFLSEGLRLYLEQVAKYRVRLLMQ